MTSSSSTNSPFLSLNLSDAYRILEVTSSANTDEIKSAYKRLALKSHPDKNPHDPFAHQKFVKISEAYKQLCEASPTVSCGDEDDEDDDDEDDEESYEHDHDFAFRMFEKMFFGKHGNKIKGRKISGGFMFSSRHECDCPHCRCYSKPKTPYIPKSQRPKDPNSPTPSKDSTTGDGTAGGVDDWLEDIEIQTKSQKNKIAKKKAIPKKKPSKESHPPPPEPSKETKISPGTSTAAVTSTTKAESTGTVKENESEVPRESKKLRREAKKKAAAEAAAAAIEAAKEEEDDDDAITAEDMASTLSHGRHSRKEIVTSAPPQPQHQPQQPQQDNKKTKVDKSVKEKTTVEIPGLNPKKSMESISEKEIPSKKGGEMNKATAGVAVSKAKRPPLDPPNKNSKTTNARGAKGSNSTPGAYLYTRQLNVLLEMGFREEQSRVALEKSVGNVDLATSFLIQLPSEPESPPSPPPAPVAVPMPPSPPPALAPTRLPPTPPAPVVIRKEPPRPAPAPHAAPPHSPASLPINRPPSAPASVPAPAPVPLMSNLFEQRAPASLHLHNPPLGLSHLGPAPGLSSSSRLLGHVNLDHHSDTDFDDFLLVPSSYESFTTQLQQQIDYEALPPSSSWGMGMGMMAQRTGSEAGQGTVSSGGGGGDASGSSSTHLLNPSLLSGAASSAASSSFLSSHESRLESEFFPSLGQIFTHEPPTLQLFHQSTPQLFQSELFIGSSPSASSTVSSVSLVSGDTLDDPQSHNNSNNNTAKATQKLSSSTTTVSTSAAPATTPAAAPTTATSGSTVVAAAAAGTGAAGGGTGGGGVGSIPVCLYFNTARGCRNSTNCKFLHIVDTDKHKDHSSSYPSSRPRPSAPGSAMKSSSSSSLSASRSNHPHHSPHSHSHHSTAAAAKVCAFYPTPAGCKLGNSCKFLHQR